MYFVDCEIQRWLSHSYDFGVACLRECKGKGVQCAVELEFFLALPIFFFEVPAVQICVDC